MAAVFTTPISTAAAAGRTTATDARPAAGSVLDDLEPRPDLAGVRVKAPNKSEVYVIDPEGYRRWIPSPSTYESLFRNWSDIHSDLNTSQIPERSKLDSDAFLAKSPSGNQVYLVSNGQKRWIVSPAAFDKYWFAWNKIREVPATALDNVPTGPEWR
ncbi:hypothetical protein [Actinoplanes sp. NPDC049118]|uniref:hypothetical protein n=1 Tax=Actinoplanes sp. NPDC049118 TaxID=3155769 RepID=UPI0033C36773